MLLLEQADLTDSLHCNYEQEALILRFQLWRHIVWKEFNSKAWAFHVILVCCCLEFCQCNIVLENNLFENNFNQNYGTLIGFNCIASKEGDVVALIFYYLKTYSRSMKFQVYNLLFHFVLVEDSYVILDCGFDQNRNDRDSANHVTSWYYIVTPWIVTLHHIH